MRRQLERAKRKAQLEREEAFKRAYRGQDVDWENPRGLVARVRKDSADSASLDEDKKLPPKTNSARKLRRKEGPTRFEELPTTDNSSDDIDVPASFPSTRPAQGRCLANLDSPIQAA